MRHRTCPHCGSVPLEEVLHRGPEVLRCRACRLVFLADFPGPAERAAIYGRDYYEEGSGERFLGALELLVRLFRRMRTRDILRRLPPRQVPPGQGGPAHREGGPCEGGPEGGSSEGRDAFLDVGCGRGVLLEEFRRRGWAAVGTQVSRTAAEAAARRGLDVRLGELPELDLPENAFRAVAFYHVLEHLDRPERYLRETHRLLRPDGLLVVEVPDAAGPGFRLLGSRNFCLDYPNHLYFFTARSLRELLEEAGFEVTAESRFSLEYSPFTTLQNLLNALPGAPGRLYRSLQRNDEARRLRREPLTWIHAALAALLAPLALLLSLGSLVLPIGNTLRFYCRKKVAGAVRVETKVPAGGGA